MSLETIVGIIHTYITKENITFLLSVFGSLGTLYTLLAQRKNLSLSIQSYRYNNKSLLMYVAFTNRSRLPISVLNVSILQDEVCYPCVYVPTVVCEHTRRSEKRLSATGKNFLSSSQYLYLLLRGHLVTCTLTSFQKTIQTMPQL